MKKDQKGFGIVEILVVLVVVGLLGTAGWLVYSHQKDKPVSSKSTTQTNQQEQKQETIKQEDTKAAEPAYFEIKELGVKFELSKAPKGLYYYMGNNGKIAYFSLDELKSTDCAADKTSQVALTRYTDEDFARDEMSASLKDKAKKIGDYYYFSLGGQSGCSDDSAVQEKATKMRADIVQLLPNALVRMQ